MIQLFALFLTFTSFQPGAHRTAELIRQRGADQEAAFDFEGALLSYRAAVAKRKEYLPAHLDYMQLMVRLGRHLRLRQEYLADSTTPFARCLSVIALGLSAHDAPQAQAQFLKLVRRDGRTPCSEVAHAWSGDDSLSNDPSLLSAALNMYGASAVLGNRYASVLVEKGKADEGSRFLRNEIGRSTGLEKARFRAFLTQQYLSRGDSASARVIIAAMDKEAAEDHRPYIRWLLLETKRTFAEYYRERSSFHDSFARYNFSMIGLTRAKVPAYTFEILTRDAQENVDRGDYLTAAKEMNEAVAIADSLNAAEFQLRAHLYRGRALNARGQYSRAIVDLHTAANRGIFLGERYRTVEAYQFVARAYTALQDWPNAMAAADTFSLLGEGIRDRSKRMILLYEAGTIYLKAGQHERARRYFEAMVRTIDRDRMNFEYAGEYLERIGDYDRALRYYRSAYLQAGSGSPKLALAGMVRVFSALGMVDSARKAAQLHDALPLSPQYEILLPRLLLEGGQIEKARALGNDWLQLQLRRGNPAATANAYNLLAEIELRGNPQAALEYAAAAIKYARPLSLSSQLAQAFRFLGLAHSRIGLRDKAVQEIKQALAFARIEKDMLTEVVLLTELGDVALPDKSLHYYGEADRVLDRISANISEPVTAARLRDTRKTLFDNAIRAAMHLDGEARLTTIGEWSARKKRSRHPFSAALMKKKRFSPIVDFVVVGDSVHAIVYGTSVNRFVTLPIGAHRSAELARQLVIPFMWVSGGSLDIGRATFAMKSARELYDGLLRPLEEMLPPGAVTIVPDAALESVPFDALVRNGAGNDYMKTEFAIDRWAFSFAPDPVSGLASPNSPNVSTSAMTFVGQNAPGVDDEFSVILRNWAPNGVELLSGASATEERLRANKNRPILHFATHGISDDADPLRSHLVLAPDKHNDGLLHAAEISGTIGRTKLVFLSACETAVGPAYSGTGSLSLARFFLNAGVSGVVATEWPISSAGVSISGEFYRRLKQGSPARSALHAAKLSVRKNPKTASPFYWASHVYVEH